MASSGPRSTHGAAVLAFAATLTVAATLTAAGCAEVEDRTASWSFVHAAIIAPNCTTSNCHSQLNATAGLQFDDREGAYTFITGLPCEPGGDSLDGNHNLVFPGQPESSRLMYLLRAEDAILMPPDVPLPEAEIEIIERWILEGAQCN